MMMTKKKTFYSQLASFSLLILVPVAHGQVVVQHTGANDPITEGFTLLQPGNAEVGPVFEDFDRDAWSIRLQSQTEYGAYEHALTERERQDAATFGWELSVTLRFLSFPDVWGNGVYFYTGAHRFSMEFFTDSDGTLWISDSLSGGDYRFEGGDDDYHRYTLVYDPLAELARLWVDGVDSEFDFRPRNSGSDASFRFGAGQVVTHAHWNEVSLTIIPEPATVALVAGILALAGAVVYRPKRTRQIRTD